MSTGIRGVVGGTRPVDWVLAGVLTVLGVVLMTWNVVVPDAEVSAAVADGTMVNALSSHSWLMVPAFAVATVPVLWWRRDVVVVTGSVPSVPEQFKGWVNPGGRLFVITGDSPAMEAKLYTRLDVTNWTEESLFETDLARLVHSEPPPEFEF